MADELSELRQEVKKLTQQVSVLEKELQQYQGSGPIGHYYEMNRWINIANELIKLKSSTLSTLVSADGKDKEFERIMVLIKSTREIIESQNSLKVLLKITDNEEKDKENGQVKPKDFLSGLAIKRPS